MQYSISKASCDPVCIVHISSLSVLGNCVTLQNATYISVYEVNQSLSSELVFVTGVLEDI